MGVLLLIILIAAGCTAPHGGNLPVSPAITQGPAAGQSPLATTTLAAPNTVFHCGFTTCHGADLSCGTSPPLNCTEEYQSGDRCRKYARCDTGGGVCTLVTGPKFVACMECAHRCQIQAGTDSLAAVSCEEAC